MLTAPPPSALLQELDVLHWDGRDPATVAAELRLRRPLWIRIGNFFDENLAVLRELPPGRRVLWKVEHRGEEARPRLWISPGTDPAAHVQELLGLGHHVVAYTFGAHSESLLRRDVAGLPHLRHVPPALTRTPPGADRAAARAALGVGDHDLLVGAAGLLTREKGLDELAVAFLRGELGDDTHLVMSLILDADHLTADDMRSRWERMAGTAAPGRLHVRLGAYGGRRWMAEFYRAVDAVLVNSVAESWCRMVSEPLGVGCPVVVRRSGCGSNHVAPGTVLVDSFSGLGGDGLLSAIHDARARAPRLRDHVHARQHGDVVRDRMVGLLRRHTTGAARRELETLLRDPDAATALDAALDH